MGNYPTEEELEYIRKFDIIKEPVYKLLDFVENIWEYGDWGFRRTEHTLELDTGGWSGNEDIINALQGNFIFWSLYWNTHTRGGHYTFDDKNVSKESQGLFLKLRR